MELIRCMGCGDDKRRSEFQSRCKLCRAGVPRTCNVCLVEKTRADFYPGQAKCKRCHLDQNKVWRAANKEKDKAGQRRGHLFRKFNMTVEQYEGRWAEQEGCCAICGAPEPVDPTWHQRLCIDHNHESGAVRGLLCRTCNTVLGQMRDDPDLLIQAAIYLEAGGWSK